MSPISLYEDGYGNVVDENDSPEPMDTSLTRMSLWLRRLPTHFECLRHAACGESFSDLPNVGRKVKRGRHSYEGSKYKTELCSLYRIR